MKKTRMKENTKSVAKRPFGKKRTKKLRQMGSSGMFLHGWKEEGLLQGLAFVTFLFPSFLRGGVTQTHWDQALGAATGTWDSQQGAGALGTAGLRRTRPRVPRNAHVQRAASCGQSVCGCGQPPILQGSPPVLQPRRGLLLLGPGPGTHWGCAAEENQVLALRTVARQRSMALCEHGGQSWLQGGPCPRRPPDIPSSDP